MRKLALSLILLLFILNAFCQVDNAVPIKGVISKLQSFYSGNTLEKVYLHLDKPWYFVGDTLYFKAYVTFGEQHEPSKLSEVLYVDLINPENKFLHSIKLQLNNGLAWGDFTLPDSLRKGNYKIRAYTKLMQHVTGECLFEQIIPVESSYNPKVVKLPQKDTKPDIQFFPEGGDMIFGVTSKIAFKAIDGNGAGLDVKGNITDNKGDTITTFNSSHLGMGFFFLHPEEGKNYKANVIYPDGRQASIDLPAPVSSGIALKVYNDDPDKLTIGVRTNKAFLDNNKGQSFYIVMNSGVNVADGTIKLTNPSMDVDLPKKRFRTGVVQLTLFSSSGEPLSERLAFIQRPDLLKLDVSSDKSTYNDYEKVSLSLSAKTASDSLVSGHFSVSVIDESKVSVNENNENTILTWLLMSSDLKGYIEQPNYYFADINKQTISDLDVLMLTQGYRRFTWKQLLGKGYPPVAYQAQKGLDIKGVITAAQGKSVAGIKVDLANLDGGPMMKGVTDTSGAFDFKYLCFSDSTRFLLKAVSDKNKNKLIIKYIEETPDPVIEGYLPQARLLATDKFLTLASLEDSTSLANTFSKYSLGKGIMLKEVKIRQSKPEEYRTIPYAGDADQVVSFENSTSDGLLSDKLNGILLGVMFITDTNFPNVKIPYLTVAQRLKGYRPMLIMVDGAKLPPGSSIDEIPFNDVQKVEVFRNASASAFGSLGGGGVISITTYKGPRPISRMPARDVLQIAAHGFYKARGFYSPKYQNTFNANYIDKRATVYWAPEIVTDKNGNAAFEFYNAGGQGVYRVVVEGIDDKGNIGRQVYRYKVE
ncbi:MAG: TonB-dependent receptor [Bacteroidetes bacterium]|jgi:hypothetical protein|nr:TonB-dependent receptor [Bacteroidota bacterium]